MHDAARDGESELVFGEAAARGHEAAEVPGNRMAGAIEIARVPLGDKRQRDGIVENAGLLHQLVRGAADGDAQSGAARLAVLHKLMVQVERLTGGEVNK